MTLKEHFSKNLYLAYPVVIGQLGHITVSVADTLMVGKVGVIPLAAATFAGTFYHVFLLFGIGVSYAVTPLVAATDPENQSKLMNYLQNAFLLNLIVVTGLFGLGFLASFFLHFFGQETAVAASAHDYLLLVMGSLIPLMVFQTFRQFSEGLSDTFNPMVVSLVANLINVGLNYLLIYGKLGFPEMGLNGAGLATLIARVAMAMMMVWIIRKKLRGFKWKFERSVVHRMIKIGIPSGLQYIFEVGAFATAAIMVGWISAEALAAHQIAVNLASISYMGATGIAAAATVRIGNQMGFQDIRNLKIAGYSGLALVAGFMAFFAIAFILFRDFLAGLYIDEPKVRVLASGLLIIASAFQLSDGLQAVGLGILRGLTDTKVPTLVTFLAFWVMAIPGAYVLGFVLELGVNGIWYALSAGLTVAAVLHIVRFGYLTARLKF